MGTGNDIDRDFDIAIEHHQAGRIAAAKILYQSILERAPEDADVLYLLGVIAYQEENREQAGDLLRRSLTVQPENPEALHLMGMVAYLEQQYDVATALIHKALTLHPEWPEAHYNLGNAWMMGGKPEEGIASYRAAIALQPHHAEAHLNLGRLLQTQGRLDDAIGSYRQVLALQPDHAEAQHDLENALALLDQARQDAPAIQLPQAAPGIARKSIQDLADPQAMEQMADAFAEHKYILIPGFFSQDICEIAKTYALFKRDFEKNIEVGVQQVPNTHSVYGDHLMESMMLFALPWVEKITRLSLFPTYAHYRVYKPGDELKKHIDRPACEISLSLCLGSEYVNTPADFSWGIWANSRHSAPKEYKMRPGDALLYRGMDVLHWREPFKAGEGSFLAQVFLHYVDANGPHANWKFDKRERLGAKHH